MHRTAMPGLGTQNFGESNMKASWSRLAKPLAGGLVSTFAITVAMSSAFAQQEKQVAAAPQTAQASAGLEEITVTARKTNENLMQVPVSITAVTAQALEDKGLEDRYELTHFTPGFQAAPQNGATATRLINAYQMRGLGTVTAFWNGVPLNGGDIPELLDLQRVEVLKGPQTAYFGRSTFAGAINYIAAEPTEDFHGKGELGFGTWGNQSASGSVSGALIPGKLTGRFAVDYRVRGAQYQNFGYGGKLGRQETKAGAASLVFTPTDDWKIKAYYTKWYEDDGPNGIAFFQSTDYTCNGGAAPTTNKNYFCGAISKAPANRISQRLTFPPGVITALAALGAKTFVGPSFFDFENGMKRRGQLAQVFSDYNLPYNITWTTTLSWMQNKAGQIQDYGNRFYTPAVINGQEQYGPSLTNYLLKDKYAETRLTSDPTARLKGMVGVSYVKSSQGIESTINKSGILSVSIPPRIAYNETVGLFGSLSYEILDGLTASFEGRYQDDKIGTNTLGVSDVSGHTKRFTPRAILAYQMDADTNLYASFSQGSRPGTFNSAFYALPAYAQAQIVTQIGGPVPFVVSEEKLNNYETGIKANFLDNTLRVIADVYLARWRGRQIGASLFYTNTAGVLAQASFTSSGGATNAAGTEWEVTWVPTDNWTVEGTYAYSYTKDLVTYCLLCNSVQGVLRPVGTKSGRFPIMTGSVATTYKHELWASGIEGYVRVDAYYHGKEYSDQTNLVWLKPYVIANMRFGVQNETYRFEIYGTNILNNRIPVEIGQQPDQVTGLNSITATPQPKTTLGARVTANF